jgi:hypothetical protein
LGFAWRILERPKSGPTALTRRGTPITMAGMEVMSQKTVNPKMSPGRSKCVMR